MNKGERKSMHGWTFEQSQFCWLWLKKMWEGENGWEWAEKNWMKCLESWSTTKVVPAEWTGEVFQRLRKTPPFGDDNFLIKVFLKYFVFTFCLGQFFRTRNAPEFQGLKCDQKINSGGFVYFQWRLNKHQSFTCAWRWLLHFDKHTWPSILSVLALTFFQ